MAKINARGAHQVGPTFYTEKTRRFDGVDSVYYEAWRLRSDGAIMTRIIRTTSDDGSRTEHRGSTFRIIAKIRKGRPIDSEILRKHLEVKGYAIVKESWR